MSTRRIRPVLTNALEAEAERRKAGATTSPRERQRLEQLLELWRSGYRGVAPEYPTESDSLEELMARYD